MTTVDDEARFAGGVGAIKAGRACKREIARAAARSAKRRIDSRGPRNRSKAGSTLVVDSATG